VAIATHVVEQDFASLVLLERDRTSSPSRVTKSSTRMVPLVNKSRTRANRGIKMHWPPVSIPKFT
jgi:hypothetical protein